MLAGLCCVVLLARAGLLWSLQGHAALSASFLPAVSRSPEAAAETVLFAATAPADQVGGRYCGTAPRVARHSAAADDEVLARRVWELSAHLCDLTADELAA